MDYILILFLYFSLLLVARVNGCLYIKNIEVGLNSKEVHPILIYTWYKPIKKYLLIYKLFEYTTVYSHSFMKLSISSACSSRLCSSLNWAFVRIRLCFGLWIL